jgi:hypothetical protein
MVGPRRVSGPVEAPGGVEHQRELVLLEERSGRLGDADPHPLRARRVVAMWSSSTASSRICASVSMILRIDEGRAGGRAGRCGA